MPQPTMFAVESSSILAMGYDPEQRELHIQFKTGKIYIYEGVPQEVYDHMLAADSIGSYFHKFIRSAYGARLG